MNEHRRRLLAIALAVLATILLIAGNLGVWFRNSILDSENFTSNVSDILREPAATERASEVLAAQALSSGELPARIQEALPAQGPLITALLDNELEAVLARSLQRILQLDAFQDALRRAIEELHDFLISTLEGRRQNLQIENEELVLNLRPAIENLFDKLGVPVPQRVDAEDAGQVVLVRNASTLDNLGAVVRAIHDVTPFLILFALLGYAGAIAAAPRFNQGLVIVGCGALAAGILSLLVWRAAGWGFSAVLEDFPLARMILDGLIGGLRWQSLVLAVAGVGLVVAGDGRAVRAFSRWTERGMQRASEFGGVRVVVLGALTLAVLLLIF